MEPKPYLDDVGLDRFKRNMLAEFRTALENKVDKIVGKVLSSNDYTDEEKATVADLKTKMTTLLSDAQTPGSVEYITLNAMLAIIDGAPEDFNTLKEMSDWISTHEDSAATMNSNIQDNARAITALQTGKVDKETGKDLSSNDFTDADKTKLVNIYPDALKLYHNWGDFSSDTVQWIRFLKGTFDATSFQNALHIVVKTTEGIIFRDPIPPTQYSEKMDAILHIHIHFEGDYTFRALEWEYLNESVLLNDFKICIDRSSNTFACYWRKQKGYQTFESQILFQSSFGIADVQWVNEDTGAEEPTAEYESYSMVYKVHPDMISAATPTNAGLMSAADKSKLDSFEARIAALENKT